ncbi:hypothetical protein YC2023_123268 [Brassica napus]
MSLLTLLATSFKTHKLVLPARSPFFKSKFFNELEPNSIYETLIAKLLAAADKYYLNRLRLLSVLETDGYQQQKAECLSLQSELLKAVAGYEESSNSIGGAKSLRFITIEGKVMFIRVILCRGTWVIASLRFM